MDRQEEFTVIAPRLRWEGKWNDGMVEDWNVGIRE
jgi:hypothetical protein